jgi:hypothetical protein
LEIGKFAPHPEHFFTANEGLMVPRILADAAGLSYGFDRFQPLDSVRKPRAMAISLVRRLNPPASHL